MAGLFQKLTYIKCQQITKMLCIINSNLLKFCDVKNTLLYALLKLIKKMKVPLLLVHNGTNILNESDISSLIELLLDVHWFDDLILGCCNIIKKLLTI